MGTSFFHTKFPTRSQAEGAVLFTNTGMCPFTDSSQLQQQQTSRSPSTTPTYRQFLTSSVRPRSTRARWQGLPKVARNLTRSFFEIGHKRCNSNDRISMSEICAQELRATFLGNHSSEATERHDNTARHYANEQRAATHQHGGHCTRYGAPHPLRGTAPVMGRCTRYGPLHPIRRGAPPTDRVQCTQSQEQTRNLRDDGRHAQGPGSSLRLMRFCAGGNATRTRPRELATFDEVLRRRECDTHKAPGARYV